MSDVRKEHVRCVWTPYEGGLTLCGRRPDAGEFVLLDMDHAYVLASSGSRLQACPTCVEEAIRGLQASAAR